MMVPLSRALQNGWRQLADHPQLWFTIAVAVAICASFIFVADKFVGIAKSAQDELVNVRIGSLQDAFAPLAAELGTQPEALRAYMGRIQEINPTIVTFDIVQESGGSWSVGLSSDKRREGERIFRQDLVLSLAASDPTHSFTVEEVQGGERFFFTARAIQSREGVLTGVVLTRQTLSVADARITENIRRAMLILVLILAVLLGLFFKHAKIIDYAVLYRKLREVDTLKDDFIAMASHELRAPLTAIRGYAEMLQDGTAGEKNKQLSLERISLSVQQLDALVVDMLDVSRIEQGRIEVKFESISTKEAVSEIIGHWGAVARGKGLALVAEVGQDIRIRADKDRFRQVVVNLLSNAIKYTARGSVTVSTKADGNSCVLTVSDTGIGMTEEERAQLFGKFYRASGRDVRDQSGTGLGLWITKQLVELQGGKIHAESIRGVGTHFIVRLPLA